MEEEGRIDRRIDYLVDSASDRLVTHTYLVELVVFGLGFQLEVNILGI